MEISIPEILYHYTSIECLFSILNNIQYVDDTNKICLRATNSSFMNDPKEYSLGGEILIDSIKRYAEKNGKNYNENMVYVNFIKSFSKASNLYVFSLSEHKDNLSMWRGYGKNANGISIGFDTKTIIEYSENLLTNRKSVSRLDKCEYDKAQTKDYFDSFLISNPNIAESVFDMKLNDLIDTSSINNRNINSLSTELTLKSTILKEKDYIEEKEWRLNTLDTIASNFFEIKFKERNNLIIPYIEHLLDAKIIKKIIIGPSHKNELMRKGLNMLLNKLNIKNIEIERSNISYRLL